MFYKYTMTWLNGNKISGYAESDKSIRDVRWHLDHYFPGMGVLKVEEYGEDFPPCNSDYIMSIK